MTKENIIVLSAFVAYMIVMIVIGFVYSKSTKNNEDYFLGGRNLGGWTAALSAQASDMSGWLLMGLPGSVYLAGTGEVWIAIGLLIGTILNWFIVSSRLRRKLADYPKLFPEPLPRQKGRCQDRFGYHHRDLLCGLHSLGIQLRRKAFCYALRQRNQLQLGLSHRSYHRRARNFGLHLYGRLQGCLYDRLYPGYAHDNRDPFGSDHRLRYTYL